MEKGRKVKFIIMITLMVAVMGMSLGFAAFSATLNVSSSASVTPNSNDFKIQFCNSSTLGACEDLGMMSFNPTIKTSNGAEDNNSGISISGGSFGVKFTKPGQYIRYSFYVHNLSEYDAYLNSVYFEKFDNGKIVRCSATTTDETKATDSLVQEACNGLKIEVIVRGANYETGSYNIPNHLLTKNSVEDVIVKIVYLSDATYVDGPMLIEIGDLKFNYSTVDSQEVKIIKFMIDGSEYQAEEGMSWNDWVSSIYNTSGLVVSESGKICVTYSDDYFSSCVFSNDERTYGYIYDGTVVAEGESYVMSSGSYSN